MLSNCVAILEKIHKNKGKVFTSGMGKKSIEMCKNKIEIKQKSGYQFYAK
ncbi:hypothetical protein ACZ87_03783 [Candidatus Erwinia dacicola]|uniref:Uncharacterized protein n=1 Tax=Candidatus Erwinia dacicola TaxID=252393 RepID=A0A328TJH5_9GAMM|nr:hypothetical protein ACZ87_03783 [Candidatus Erwinia dacicola]